MQICDIESKKKKVKIGTNRNELKQQSECLSIVFTAPLIEMINVVAFWTGILYGTVNLSLTSHCFMIHCSVVQSFQEEDEDMEEGIKTVTRILGPDNVYLYPSILQLVMADAAFAGQ